MDWSKVSVSWCRECRSTLIMLVVGLVVTSSACEHASTGDQMADRGEVFDVGDVSLDDGPVEVSHTFVIVNDGESPLCVVDVIKSCGCAKSDIEHKEISVGGSTEIRVTYTVHSPGARSESVSVFFDDGASKHFSIAARGIVSKTLTVIPVGVLDENQILNVQLVYVANEKHEIRPRVYLIGANTIGFEQSQWTVIEEYSKELGRPLRLIANGVLDFTEFRGEFPVTIDVESENGVRASVDVAESLAGSDSR